jgi:hypothetical protein
VDKPRMGRHDDVYEIRVKAAKIAKDRDFEDDHQDNGEENEYKDKDGNRNFIANYTKGFRHHPKTDRDAGEVINADYRKLVDAMESGDPDDFEDLTLGLGRKLTSPQAGLMFDLEGPDSQDIGIRKAPRIDGAEAAGEMAEVYWMALCRDVPFGQFGTNATIDDAVTDLSTNYSDFPHPFPRKDGILVESITRDTIFRGVTPGDRVVGSPYISQFLYQPIPWGPQTLEQVQPVLQKIDYLKTYDDWLSAQDGEMIDDTDKIDNGIPPRPILTPRDLAYYVHVDALYQAYLGACLILLNTKDKTKPPPNNVYNFDPLLPYQKPESTQMGFAVFGGPHILSLVTEVATRALKAVWFQKWGVHRRLRPEAFGGLIHRQLHSDSPTPTPSLTKPDPSYETKIHGDILGKTGPNQILEKIRATYGSYLLPQTFPEGSPTHPSYGAGHATVAGACVTVLKAWFKEDDIIFKPKRPNTAGTGIEDAPTLSLKVGDELNKVAANIAIGRNWAGVHYRSDYTESILLGEQIALGILQEQATCYHKKDPFACRLTRFDGQPIKIEGTKITEI